MKSQVICGALNTVNPTPAQRARMRAALEAQLPAEKPHRRGAHQQKASSQRWWTIIPAAAALFAVVLLGIFVLGRTDKTCLLYTSRTSARARSCVWATARK